MSEETEQPTPNDKESTPKPAKPLVPKKPAFNSFLQKNNKFTSSKAGNPSTRGKSFKGGGVKKGK